MPNQIHNEESRFKKFIFNEVSLALSIAAAIFWLMNYVNSPINKIQLDIALMQERVAGISITHEQLKTHQEKVDEQIVEINQKLTKILTILEDQKK